jgi:hypothetical protein
MAAFFSFTLVVVLLLVHLQSVIASNISPYESGYNHGCEDAQIPVPSDRYINQPEKGPDDHTNEFMSGYNDGFDSCRVGTEDNTFIGEQYNETSSFVNTTGGTGQVNTTDANSNITSSETVQTSDDDFGWVTGIAILLIFAIIIAAVWRLTHRRKKRQYFSSDVKRKVLKNQDYKCANCKKSAGVWDYDHHDGDRSNNDISNCQALCPNCHAKKTRGLLKEVKSSSRRGILIAIVIIIIILAILAIGYT